MQQAQLVLIVLSSLALQSTGVPLSDFYSYGPDAGDTVLPRGEAASSEVALLNQFWFYGTGYSNISVNSNGVLSLGQALSSSLTVPEIFPSDKAIIAPFWTNYDNHSPNTRGHVYYRVSNVHDEINRASQEIQFASRSPFSASSLLIVTWENVHAVGNSNITNTFQCVLAMSNSQSYVIIHYGDGLMQWVGSPFAQVGVNAGDSNKSLTFPDSNTERVMGISETGNSGSQGLWILRVHSTDAQMPGVILGWDQLDFNVGEESGSIDICVSIVSGNMTTSFVVAAVTEPGTAARSKDYPHRTYRFTFSPSPPSVTGEESSNRVCTTVYFNDDSVFEEEEYFSLRLQPVSSGTEGQHVAIIPQLTNIHIRDDDVVYIEHSRPTVTVTENQALVSVCAVLKDSKSNTITSQRGVKVGYSTQHGTALENEDFVPIVNGEIVFQSGVVTSCGEVEIVNDDVFENDEMFYFAFSEVISQDRVNIDTTMTTVTIKDEDGPSVTVELDQSAYTLVEGGRFTACVQITAGELGGSFSVTLQTRYPAELIQGNVVPATNGDDYTGELEILNFNPSNARDAQCIDVQTIEDVLYEGEEIFGLVLTTDSSVTFPKPRVTVFLSDNDYVGISLIQNSFDFHEGQDREAIRICANRTGEIQRRLVITVTPQLETATFYDRATRTGDVERDIATIDFQPDNYQSCTAITIRDDYVLEHPVETFSVSLSHADSHIQLGVDFATVAIHDNDQVRISFFRDPNANVLENGMTVPRVCIQREGLIDIPVHVSLQPVNGTATELLDYEATGETIIFRSNSESLAVSCPTISITLYDDPVVEGDEEVVLQLVSDEPERVIVTDNDGYPLTSVLTIEENDAVYVSFTNQVFSVSEGDGGVDVCLTMRGFTILPFTVYVSTWPDSAKEGIDFLPQNVVIQFPPTPQTILDALYQLPPAERMTAPLPNSEPQCARISIIDDKVLEAVSSKILVLNVQENETYVRLEDPHSVIVTISDDDFVTAVLETNQVEVSEGVSTVRVCAHLMGTADFDINAQLQTVPSSATAGLDFTSVTGSLVFPAHSTDSQCLEITIVDDIILEHEEDFLVELSITEANSLVVAADNNTLTVTIIDNDFVEVEFQQREYSPEEGDGSVTVCAEMSGRTDREVSVLFSTRLSQEGALATANVDYTEIVNASFFEGVLTDSLRTQCISVTLIVDEILEDTESFEVSLNSLDSGARVTEMGVASVYILDDDGVRMGLQEREYETNEDQGTVPICVELIGRIEKSIAVTLSTRPVTASGDDDYVSVRSLTLTFEASELNEQLLCSNFTIIDDPIYEETERFFIMLSIDNTAVSVHIPRATVYIADNDGVTVGFQSVNYEVSEGDGQVEVCLVMDGRTEIDVINSILAEPGSAVQDAENGLGDFAYNPLQHLVFPPSVNGGVQCTHINITDDQILESIELFKVFASSEMPRVSLTPNTSNVYIIDNDHVTVGFEEVLFNVSEELESERNITVCVGLSGELERSVVVTVATESAPGSTGVANSVDDYLPVETELTFTHDQENKTHCVMVTVLDDRLVEREERFDIVLTTEDTGVELAEDRKRATVVVTDEDVVCERDGTDTSRGFFDWPESYPNEIIRLPCVNGTTVRMCDSNGVWEPPFINDCYASIDAIIKHVIENIVTDDGNLSKEIFKELIKALLLLKDTNPEGLGKFLGSIVTIFQNYSQNVDDNTVAVDPEIFELIVDIVDILHFPEWPKHMVQEHSVRLVESVETVTAGLVKDNGFRELNLNDTFMGFLAEKGPVDEVIPLNQPNKTIIFERHPESGIVARLSSSQTSDVIGLEFLASISLPVSIAEQLRLGEGDVGLFFSFFETSVMFPLVNSTDLSVSNASHIVSPVVAATVSQTQIQELKDLVNYTISIDSKLNYSDPTCVSWDFSAAGGQGNWTNEGCKLESDRNGVITCSCSHLTNFAVLLDIRTRGGELGVTPVNTALSTISIVGVAISLLGLTLTVVTLLLFGKLRRQDSTVLRIQLCISLALMLLAFVCGIERVEIFEVCVTISALIHYFTLVSMMWMAAEALLMFQKLIVVFTKTSVAYFVIVSIICWLLPIPAVVVPIGIDRNFSIHENYCFISHHIVFYAAFLGPILAILIFNIIIFIMALIVVLRHSARRYRDTEKARKRRGAVWTIFNILCIMAIFGLTWVFGGLTVQGSRDSPFEFLFVIFNSLQGFFIFLFFVVLAKETRELWLQTCGCKKQKPEEEVVETATVTRVPSLRKQRDSTGSLGSFDYDGADRLEALKALDKEARLNMNSWDVMYVMPQNTFDIFLNSDQFQAPCFIGVGPNSQPPPAVASSAISDVREDQSIVDSGILIDHSKATPSRSPLRLVGEPLDSPKKRNSHHIHSVSGIGYVSADSSDEDFRGQEDNSPTLSTPPTSRRGQSPPVPEGTQTDINVHQHDPELGIVTSDCVVQVTQ